MDCLDEIQVYNRALTVLRTSKHWLVVPRWHATDQYAAPDVNAGSDQSIQLPTDSLQLSSTIGDDGLPSGSLTFSWTQQSGPGTADLRTRQPERHCTLHYRYYT